MAMDKFGSNNFGLDWIGGWNIGENK